MEFMAIEVLLEALEGFFPYTCVEIVYRIASDAPLVIPYVFLRPPY